MSDPVSDVAAQVPKKAVKRRSWRRRLVFSAIIVCVNLALLEGFLRVVWDRPPELVGEQLINSGLFQPDAKTGWRPTPNFEFQHHLYSNPDYEIRTNSRGLRCREHSESGATRPRIAILGDSFAFGYGVESDKTISSQMQEWATSIGQEAIETINLGVTGYNLAQSHAFLEAEGVRYQPAVVVLLVCQNDITTQNIHTMNGSGHHDNRHLKPQTGLLGWIKSSYIYSFSSHSAATIRPLRRLLQAIGAKEEDAGFELLDSMIRPSLRVYPPSLQVQWRESMGNLRDIQTTCNRIGAQLLVVAVPSRQQVVPGSLTETLAYVNFKEADFDMRKWGQELTVECKKLGIQCLDPIEALQSEDDRYYLKFDMHLNASGCEMLALQIRQRVLAILRPR